MRVPNRGGGRTDPVCHRVVSVTVLIGMTVLLPGCAESGGGIGGGGNEVIEYNINNTWRADDGDEFFMLSLEQIPNGDGTHTIMGGNAEFYSIDTGWGSRNFDAVMDFATDTIHFFWLDGRPGPAFGIIDCELNDTPDDGNGWLSCRRGTMWVDGKAYELLGGEDDFLDLSVSGAWTSSDKDAVLMLIEDDDGEPMTFTSIRYQDEPGLPEIVERVRVVSRNGELVLASASTWLRGGRLICDALASSASGIPSCDDPVLLIDDHVFRRHQ